MTMIILARMTNQIGQLPSVRSIYVPALFAISFYSDSLTGRVTYIPYSISTSSVLVHKYAKLRIFAYFYCLITDLVNAVVYSLFDFSVSHRGSGMYEFIILSILCSQYLIRDTMQILLQLSIHRSLGHELTRCGKHRLSSEFRLLMRMSSQV